MLSTQETLLERTATGLDILRVLKRGLEAKEVGPLMWEIVPSETLNRLCLAPHEHLLTTQPYLRILPSSFYFQSGFVFASVNWRRGCIEPIIAKQTTVLILASASRGILKWYICPFCGCGSCFQERVGPALPKVWNFWPGLDFVVMPRTLFFRTVRTQGRICNFLFPRSYPVSAVMLQCLGLFPSSPLLSQIYILRYIRDPRKNVLQSGVTRNVALKTGHFVNFCTVLHLRICKRTYRIWDCFSVTDQKTSHSLGFWLFIQLDGVGIWCVQHSCWHSFVDFGLLVVTDESLTYIYEFNIKERRGRMKLRSLVSCVKITLYHGLQFGEFLTLFTRAFRPERQGEKCPWTNKQCMV